MLRKNIFDIDEENIEKLYNINTNKYKIGDQGQYLKQDGRIIVEDFYKFPWNCIGKIVAKFHVKTAKGIQIKTLFGTGSLVSKNVVLTSAHNFYNFDYNVKAFKAHFVPFDQDKQTNDALQTIEIQVPYLHPNFLDFRNKYHQRYDIVLALLKQNYSLQQNRFLKIDWDYSFLQSLKKNIIVAGYSADHQQTNLLDQTKQNNVLSFSQNLPYDQKQNFLYYKHTTCRGNSGGPVLYRRSQKQQYKIIAIHKGDLQNCNYGISFSSGPTTKQIFNQLVMKNKLQKQLKTLINQSSSLPSSEQVKKLIKENNALILRIDQLRQQNQEYKSNNLRLQKQNSRLNYKLSSLIKELQNNTRPSRHSSSLVKSNFLWQKSIKQPLLEKNIKGYFKSSKIVTNNKQTQFILSCFNDENYTQSNFILDFFNKKTKIKQIKFLYRASQNQFQVFKFRQKCKDKPHTLTLCQTQFGKIIGGYTPFKWKEQYQKCNNLFYKFDKEKKSFIFSLTNSQKFTINPQYQKYQIYCNNNYGPSFGRGSDLQISNKANQNRYSYAYIGFTYCHPNYQYDNQYSWNRFSGATQGYEFKVKEWEVWGVEFQ